MTDQLNQIMAVMDGAFDPCWGEAWNRRQVSDALATPNTHCLLAQSDGNPSSAAGFLLSRAAPGEEEILLLAVLPEYRRRGIAGHLMTNYKQAAKARGAERLFLEVRVNNPAIAFYRAHGFAPVGRRREYYRQRNGSYLDAITFAHNIADIANSPV